MSLQEIMERQQRKWDAERMAQWATQDRTDVRSYSIGPKSIDVKYEDMTDEELRNMLEWRPIEPVSRACLLAAAKNRYPVGVVRVIENVKKELL